MTFDQLTAFLNCAARYQSPTQNKRNHLLHTQTFKVAAVLLAIVCKDGRWQILLTRRTEHLRHHTGQIALAGGKRETQDISLTHTALREAREEVGIAENSWRTFPILAPHYSPSGYQVHPVPALCTAEPPLRPDPAEVAEAFYLPLDIALNLENYTSRTLSCRGRDLQMPALPYLHYDIWGLTAVILYSFAERYRKHIQTGVAPMPSEKISRTT